ncbi:SAM-dependent methyltransferase [Pseudonocardia sp. S2-4]|uniref:SAM-dependent methyltransferase n=2 Tax=Pseudonocardia humida TaxID=2800819 RepID=A0ABT1AA64_9PSEU|nr:SAM-dependent methyltransferase [Pseudonocardia humida]
MTTDDYRSGTGIDTTVPHSARIWNYWLGGKDNYPVDREAGEAWLAIDPEMGVAVKASREFLQRAVRYLAREAGIRQFLDIGTGLPTADNTHEVAQRVAPDARIVYVDNDPLILAHARALMTSTPEGATHYMHTDMRDAAHLLELASEHLDLGKPVAVVLQMVLGHLPTEQEVRALIRALVDAVVPGSYLLICDAIETEEAQAAQKAGQQYNHSGAVPYHVHPLAVLRSRFDGLEFVEPGLVSAPRWRPDDRDGLPSVGLGEPEPVTNVFGGLARKPTSWAASTRASDPS